jgi:hypothetical protein
LLGIQLALLFAATRFVVRRMADRSVARLSAVLLGWIVGAACVYIAAAAARDLADRLVGPCILLSVQLTVQLALTWFPARRAAGSPAFRFFAFLAWLASASLSVILALGIVGVVGDASSNQHELFIILYLLYKYILFFASGGWVAVVLFLHFFAPFRGAARALSSCATFIMKSAVLTALAALTSLFFLRQGGGGYDFTGVGSLLGMIGGGGVFYLELGPWLFVAIVRNSRGRARRTEPLIPTESTASGPPVTARVERRVNRLMDFLLGPGAGDAPDAEAAPPRPAGWLQHWFAGLMIILLSVLAAAAMMTLWLPQDQTTWMTAYIRRRS